jgi:hypothetical protein
MSDRTQGSVRTESPSGDAAASDGTAPGSPPPVSATQSIPTAGSQRAQAPATGSTPAGTAAPVVTAPGATSSSGKSSSGSSSSGTSSGATSAGGPSAGATSMGAPSAGATMVPPSGGAVGAPTVPPTGGPVGAPPVPPVTGSATAAEAGRPDAAAQSGAPTAARGVRGRGPARQSGRGPRRARLQLRHIDTWSALKISLVLSIALFFIWMVAVGILYGVLSALGVFETVNELFGQIGSASGAENPGDVVTWQVVLWGAAVIGAINIVLMTALCTVGTFIYNLCSDLVGGLELTLSERD